MKERTFHTHKKTAIALVVGQLFSFYISTSAQASQVFQVAQNAVKESTQELKEQSLAKINERIVAQNTTNKTARTSTASPTPNTNTSTNAFNGDSNSSSAAPKTDNEDTNSKVNSSSKASEAVEVTLAPGVVAKKVTLDEVQKNTIINLDKDSGFSTPRVDVAGVSFLQASEILNKYALSWEVRENKISYTRMADKAQFILNLENGELSFSGRVLGKLEAISLQEAGAPRKDNIFLSVNTITVLTGTKADIKEQSVSFTLDSRLIANTDFRILVDGGDIVERAVVRGSVILVPIESIAKALGQSLVWDRAKGVIKNYRLHDGASVEVQVATGLVKINDKIVGISPGSFNNDPSRGLVTSELAKTLTAVEMSIDSQSSVIEFSLNDRLKNTALPLEDVQKDIESRPFKLLRLDYQISLPGGANVQARAQWAQYSANIRFDVDNLFKTVDSSALKLKNEAVLWSSAYGSSGSFGIVSATRRELQGVDGANFRGATYFKPVDDFAFGLVAGQIPKNSPTKGEYFEGYYLGARYYPRKKPASEFSWEAGVSVVDDPESGKKMNILSVNTQSASSKKDSAVWSAQFDGGSYESNNIPSTTTARAIGYYSKDIAKDTRLSADVSYVGVGYREMEVINATNVLRDEAKFGVGVNFPEFQSLGLKIYPGVRYDHQQLGFLKGQQWSKKSDTYWGSLSTIIAKWSVSASLGRQSIKEDWINEKSSDVVINASAARQFNNGSLDLRYNSALAIDQKVGSVSWSFNPFSYQSKYGNSQVNLGVSSYFGQVSGQSFTSFRNNSGVTHTFPTYAGLSTSINAGIASGWDTNTKSIQNTSYVNVRAEKKVFDSALGSGKVFASLQRDAGGKWGVFVGLNMSQIFARDSGAGVVLQDKGVLRGQVYLKPEFASAIKPDYKPAAGELGLGVQTQVRVKNTPIKLITDRVGNYTIQNMPPGVYNVEVDTGQLPLNYKVDESYKGLASVARGKITELNVPLVLSGVVKGRVIDASEGADIKLIFNPFSNTNITSPVNSNAASSNTQAGKNTNSTTPKETVSTVGFGGQFVFDSLGLGEYEVRSRSEKGEVSICKAVVSASALEVSCPPVSQKDLPIIQ